MRHITFVMLSIIIVFVLKAKGWKIQLNNPHPAFDPNFYKSVLEPKVCQHQLRYIRNNALLTSMFADASAKIPTGILGGNLLDLGRYHQCLTINYETNNLAIEGKYCAIVFELADIFNIFRDNNHINVTKNKPRIRLFLLEQLLDAYKIKMVMQWLTATQRDNFFFSEMDNQNSSRQAMSGLGLASALSLVVGLGVCVPKPCTTYQVLNSSLFDVSRVIPFTEDYCRLPDDKLWSPADTVAVVVFSFIGILTLLCTAYDVTHKFILKTDAINSHLQMFSSYSNYRRLVTGTASSSPDTLRCLDGVRVLATLWVVLGHCVVFHNNYLNSTDLLNWIQGMESLYISSAPMTVDTFFTMSGMLLVYNTCLKMNGKKLVKNLHLLYLWRVLRLFPLLASAVLLQASFFHRVSDGPLWGSVARATDNCRTGWWITLLHLQNILINEKCLTHAWYIAIDVHLYIISPIILFWVLGESKQGAWIALSAGLLVTLTGAAVYNFNNNFLVNVIPHPRKMMKVRDYTRHYYINVLTRAAPFIVGMVFGYLLHTCRGTRVHLSRPVVAICWCSAAVASAAILLSTHYTSQDDWDHQLVDNFLNTFMRPAWASAVGWMVFACVHGYGGPVNRFLSLGVWRVPARLCYGVYLFHAPLMMVIGASVTTLDYFSPGKFMFMFLGYASISFLVSGFANVLIDAPFSKIFKRMLEKRKTNHPEQIVERL